MGIEAVESDRVGNTGFGVCRIIIEVLFVYNKFLDATNHNERREWRRIG